jgi:hypothetical protein
MNNLQHYIDSLIAKGAEFQVGIRGSAQPLGPAKVEHVADSIGLYRMLVPATIQANKNSRPSTVVLPIVFSGADVMLVIESPLQQDGSDLIVTPGNGRTAGGLHIPGQ